jgi:hypothetical protein
MCTAGSKAFGVGLSKLSGAHVTPLGILDALLGAIGFDNLGLVLSFLLISLFILFEMEMFTLGYYIGICYLFI